MAEYPNLAAGISRAFIQGPGVATRTSDAQIARTAINQSEDQSTPSQTARPPPAHPFLFTNLYNSVGAFRKPNPGDAEPVGK